MRLPKSLLVVLWSFPLIILIHGAEEFMAGLSNGTAAQLRNYASLLPVLDMLNKEQAVYIVYILLLLVISLAIPLLLSKKRPAILSVLCILGFYFLYQIHHITEGIWFWRYNPGLVSSFLYLVAGYYFWKGFIKLLSMPNDLD